MKIGHVNPERQNRLLAALKPVDLRLISSDLDVVSYNAGDVLFEPMQDVDHVDFPSKGMIASLVLSLRDGSSAETAMIGLEGAVGGIVSAGGKPAFTRGIVQIGGEALRVHTDALESAKQHSATLREHFARYGDCLLAQTLQSVACNALHDFDARLARWLLTIHDRVGEDELHVTQEFIGQMLGVHRSYATRVLGTFESDGSIERSRARITILDRPKIERRACECYGYMRRHFERLLPGVYPEIGN